jgi:alcohol dehydrogenase/propanol-preferring alcohol dehydrogenase
MKSYKIIENGKPLKQVEIDKPVPVGDEILVKTVSCGVCHSDVHIYEGFFRFRWRCKASFTSKRSCHGP